MNSYLDSQKIDKKYFAIDTFSGFTAKDIEQEDPNLRKFYENHQFQINTKKWFEYTMIYNGVKRVVAIQADVNTFDLTKLGNLCFILLDIDLYRPTKKSIKELYTSLTPGGIMIVDDCNPNVVAWKGAFQAYVEFMKEIHQPIDIVHNQLGLLRK